MGLVKICSKNNGEWDMIPQSKSSIPQSKDEIRLDKGATDNVIGGVKTIESNLRDLARQFNTVDSDLEEWQGQAGDAARNKSQSIKVLIDALADQIGEFADGVGRGKVLMEQVDEDMAGMCIAGGK